MAFELSFAEPHDAARIAEIHMAAFGSNRMLLAQFPTEKARQDLQVSIERKALADIHCENVTVLIVKETQLGSDRREVNGASEKGTAAGSSEHHTANKDVIVSFAKWSHPVEAAEADSAEAPWEYPAETDWDVLNQWTDLIESAQDRLLGSQPCYKLSYIGTHPQYQKRGAASSMVKWAVNRCTKENQMAYLEGTLEARRLYEKHGFVAAGSASMDLQPVPGTDIGGPYSETCFIFRPDDPR